MEIDQVGAAAGKGRAAPSPMTAGTPAWRAAPAMSGERSTTTTPDPRAAKATA